MRAAAGWEARSDWFHEQTLPVATWLVEAVAPPFALSSTFHVRRTGG